MIVTVLFILTLAFIVKLAIDHIRWYYIDLTTDIESDVFIKENYEKNLTNFTKKENYIEE